MNLTLTQADFAALSPLLILLFGALAILLLESFAEEASKKFSVVLAVGFLSVALYAAFFAPVSHSQLLTPWLRFDGLTRFFTIFFILIGIGTALLSVSFFERFEVSRGEYYFLLLSALFGLILIGDSADFLTLFLGLETLSISLYILCGYMKKWEISQESAVKYFLMGSMATAFLLYGIALIYGAIGTTSFDGMLGSYQALAKGPEKILFLSGIALVTLGFAFKAAIVPFHVWAPDVYEGASNPVTAFMAVGTKVGAFTAFIRLFLEALPQFDPLWNQGIALLAYPTLIYANIVAMKQKQLRRFFAYSGISHAGFSLIPLAAGTAEALHALLFYLCVYALATFGSFAILAFLDKGSEGVRMQDLRGLFYRSPFAASLFTLCLLTLAGIPPTAGFFAKFYIFQVAFQAGYHALVVVALLTTVLSAYYYVRIVTEMLTENPIVEKPLAYSWTAATVGLVSFASIFLLSCFPEPFLALLELSSP